jgi:hypothetical protein
MPRGRLAGSVYADIHVTTKHSYDINYRYKFVCVNDDCSFRYARPSSRNYRYRMRPATIV